ncbi:MAG: tetratricopeptide repeat protein [Bacteroidales bacterium]|nr:tetratricopeptide repeat protein [Bacteroidales bacterium]
MIKYLLLLIFIPITVYSSAQTKVDSIIVSLNTLSGNKKMQAFNSISHYYFSHDLNTCLAYADSFAMYAEEVDEYFWRSHSEKLRGMILNELSRFDEAIVAYKDAVTYANLDNNSLQLGRAYSSLGYSFIYSEQFDSAMVYLLIANNILSNIPDSLQLMKVISGLADCYVQTNNYDKALKYQKTVCRWSLANGHMGSYALGLANLGIINIDLDNNNEALKYFKKALKIDVVEVEWQSDLIFSNMGSAYLSLEKYDSSLMYFEKAYTIFKTRGDQYNMGYTLNSLSEIYYIRNNPSKALGLVLQSIVIAKEINSAALLRDDHRNLVKYQITVGNSRASLQSFEAYLKLRDSLFNEQMSDQLIEMQEQFKSELKEKENLVLKKNLNIAVAKTRLNRAYIGLLLAALALVVIASVSIYLYYRNKRRTSQLKIHISEQENEKLGLENKAKTIEEQRLKDILFSEKQINKFQHEKLESSRKRLHCTSLQIIRQNQCFSQLRSMLEEDKSEAFSNGNKLDNAIRYINQSVDEDTNWIQFRHEFDDSYPGFIERLSDKFRQLTDRELLLLALIRSNLTSRQIADIFNIEIASVKKSRTRIIKKMDIELQSGLYDYLCSL